MKIDLFKGDCLEILKTLPDNSVDLCLTDPPYGTTACKWDTIIPFEPLWKELHRVVKYKGAICLFGSEPFSSLLRTSNLKGFKYDWIWDKVKAGNIVLSGYQPLKTHEIISVFGNGKVRYFPQKTFAEKIRTDHLRKPLVNRTDSTIFAPGLAKYSKNYEPDKKLPISIQTFSKDNYKGNRHHPTQKPVALLEYLIKTYTLEGETVLDFTMGSGSTGVAAKNLNRNFIGIELDEKYFEIAKQRIGVE